jgi:YHS domain-containing protein
MGIQALGRAGRQDPLGGLRRTLFGGARPKPLTPGRQQGIIQADRSRGRAAMLRFTRLGLVTLTMLAVAPAASAAEDPVYTGTFSNLAVSGYDPVAYFTDGRPVEGDARYAYDWQGATWRFANAENLERFKAEPARYAPQYGGYCAWAVSQGYTASVDPQAWKIVGDKLYLNYSLDVQRQWQGDIPGNIAMADANWPVVLGK